MLIASSWHTWAEWQRHLGHQQTGLTAAVQSGWRLVSFIIQENRRRRREPLGHTITHYSQWYNTEWRSGDEVIVKSVIGPYFKYYNLKCEWHIERRKGGAMCTSFLLRYFPLHITAGIKSGHRHALSRTALHPLPHIHTDTCSVFYYLCQQTKLDTTGLWASKLKYTQLKEGNPSLLLFF